MGFLDWLFIGWNVVLVVRISRERKILGFIVGFEKWFLEKFVFLVIGNKVYNLIFEYS